jgi:AcrR family transcriptional regulator
MPRQLRDGTVTGARQWSRTAQTQSALLDTARQVFTERGFSESSIAEIVERAGSSVGSLYHHFGGKSELFIALWEQHQHAHEDAASKAVADAREKGVTDSGQLFEIGSRAFLHGSWQRRDLVLLFSSGDVPPGFDVMRRRRAREWIGQNDSLLRLTDRPEDRVYAAILTSLIGEGAYEVAGAKSRRQAEKIIDAIIEYARRLMTGGPWHPGDEPSGMPALLDTRAGLEP